MNKLKVTKQTTEDPNAWSSPGESMSPSKEYIKSYNKDHPKNPMPKNATISKKEQKQFQEEGWATGYTGAAEKPAKPKPAATPEPKPAVKQGTVGKLETKPVENISNNTTSTDRNPMPMQQPVVSTFSTKDEKMLGKRSGMKGSTKTHKFKRPKGGFNYGR